MNMKWNVILILLLIFGLTVSAGYSAYSFRKESSGVHMPIEADEALSILESHEEAAAFISENLANESGRITRVNLKWNKDADTYVWDIELMERECGCKVGTMEGLNVLRAQVDPVSGKVLNLTTRTGVKEEALSKERCMEGCHKSGESPRPQVQSEV